MIYIKSLHIENYKCYEYVDVEFNNSTNIIVGNNEAGKSTIFEALNLCLSGLVNGRYIKTKTGMAAIEQAYTSYIPPEKFFSLNIPLFLLFVNKLSQGIKCIT